jgi:uncharacterized RDD family membrane protein YckC
VHLPEHASLAEAGRRALATLIDVLVAGFVVLKSWEMTLGDLVAVEVWLSLRGVELCIGLLLTGFVLSCGGEAILGRSLGKLLTGCEVISVLPKAEEQENRPVFRQLLVRNLVKWLLPPVAMSVLFDATLRHRGDLIAGTAVVVWQPEDDEEGFD